MSLKSIMDQPAMRYYKLPDHVLQSGNVPSGQAYYDALAQTAQTYPQLVIVEDFLNGFIQGMSFQGNAQCEAAMQGMIFYGFELVENRQVYIPSKSMVAVIAYQKLQAQVSLFYA